MINRNGVRLGSACLLCCFLGYNLLLEQWIEKTVVETCGNICRQPGQQKQGKQSTSDQGASDSLLRVTRLSCESPPQKYCKCYSFSASWKQSRELSSSGQWGLAARSHSPWERRVRRERARLWNCSHACCGWGLELHRGKGLSTAQKQSYRCPFAALMRTGIRFFLELEGWFWTGKVYVKLGQQEKVHAEMYGNSCLPTPFCLLLRRIRKQLWCLSHLLPAGPSLGPEALLL